MSNKKIKYYSLGMLLLCVCLVTGFTGPGFTIKGTIKGCPDGNIYFWYYQSKTSLHVDTVKVKGQQFTFKGEVSLPTRYHIRLNGEQDLSFYVDNTDITINADLDSFSNAVIKGSVTQDGLDDYYNHFKKPFREKGAAIYAGKFAIIQQEKRMPGITEEANFNKEFAVLEAEDDQATATYIKTHHDLYAMAEVVYVHYLLGHYYDKAKQFYNLLSPSVQHSYYGELTKTKLDELDRTKTGVPAPDFSMADVDGKMIRLSDFRGKYVLIDFWASWCGPCRAENPNVLKAYQAYKDKGFTVLGISLDKADGKANWIKAIKDDHLEWTQVSELKYFDNTAAKLYGVNAIPQNFLISPDGKIIATGLRGKALDDTLSTLFKNK